MAEVQYSDEGLKIFKSGTVRELRAELDPDYEVDFEGLESFSDYLEDRSLTVSNFFAFETEDRLTLVPQLTPDEYPQEVDLNPKNFHPELQLEYSEEGLSYSTDFYRPVYEGKIADSIVAELEGIIIDGIESFLED